MKVRKAKPVDEGQERKSPVDFEPIAHRVFGNPSLRRLRNLRWKV
jgi:hypothetical protein